MALTTKQRGVLKGMIAGAATTVVVMIAAILVGPFLPSLEASTDERIAFALKADTIIVLWLALSVGWLARHRFFTPDDIDGGGLSQGTEKARILQATLQNTLEQTILAVLVHLLWAIMMPIAWMSVIPAAAILFLCGRVLFIRGYGGGAPCRAFGFALTFYPSVLMLVGIVVTAISQYGG